MPGPCLETSINPEDAPLFESLLAIGQVIAAGRVKFGGPYIREASSCIADLTNKVVAITRRYNHGSILRKSA